VRIIFGDDRVFVPFIFACLHDAEGAFDLKQDDRDHQGLGEMPGVVLREGEIVRHLKLPSLRGDHPRSTGAGRVRTSAAVTSKAKP
jgi:hypothetical protein